MSGSLIFLITDYQNQDEFAGILKASIYKSAKSSVKVVDLTHSLTIGDIFSANRLVKRNLNFLAGAITVVVVDPTVGTKREALALLCDINGSLSYFIGPDNGVLSCVFDFAVKAISLSDELRHQTQQLFGPRVGNTFDGRDLFAKAAAICANGEFSALGQEKAIDELKKLEVPEAEFSQGAVTCVVNWIDAFGNVELNLRPELVDFPKDRHVLIKVNQSEFVLRVVNAFADLNENELGLLIDSYGYWTVVKNKKSAAMDLNACPAMPTTLKWL